jgi:hypothetical protein
MSLAYTYCLNLTKEQKIAIDAQVLKNQKAAVLLVKEFPVKVKSKVRRVKNKSVKVILFIAAGSTFWFTAVQPCEAIGVSIPPPSLPPMERLLPSSPNQWQMPISKTRLIKRDLISFKSNTDVLLLIYLTDPRLSSNSEILKIVNNLRGGSWKMTLVGNAVLVLVLGLVWLVNSAAGGFITPPSDPGWNLPHGLYDPPGLVRPADCDTRLYAGPTQSLKTWESHNQSNPKDRFIRVPGHKEVILRYGQSKYKTSDHGALAGLPYKIKNNGGTKTLVTDKNVEVLMDLAEAVLRDSDSKWFEDGTYQKGTDREQDSVNVLNEKFNRVVILDRETRQFITVCEPAEDEVDDLIDTSNFGGRDESWFGVKNLPPKKPFTMENFTPVNSFESDVLQTTPAPVMSMEETSPNEIPNQDRGFTPFNSFENDVLGITALDPDHDWQI